MKEKLLLLKWAESDFVFENILKEKYTCNERKIAHHESWFSSNRSVIKGCIHLAKQLLPVFFISMFRKTFVFGTNVCRFLYIPALINRKVILVFNEIPNYFSFFDRIFIRLVRKQIFVSSSARERYFEDKFNIKIGGVLPNIPELKTHDANINNKDKKKLIVYAGLINSKRISEKLINDLSKSEFKLDLLGTNLNFDFNRPGLTYLGKKTQLEAQEIQQRYRYALLSYSTEDTNNDLCAPIKIYEYVNAKCVCVIANKNLGLLEYIEKYPAIFVYIENLESYSFDEDEYQIEREKFFNDEMTQLDNSMRKFAVLWN
ncbi:hypothetical protein [Pseudoalteromonas luteoviolacea]|uniref:Glycosyl transferase family 1 domain-containing protein n=1 Tax=Pseudoalteromonas luteoviolacea H33 TaxID=1365251 RepID=A0A167EZ47_9GAMM|nr:hypothetical protein [Pseudoalteromonas luteoviolacea]KZN51386.1 hypothetical protein N476_13440 [Pseudoalteromonas luteoviolacea H33]KZN71443.1 hypothetical protein N477_03980 [Pseudoalteromonas luteoviolacea H33-S]